MSANEQTSTTVIWDKETGEPIHNAIVWQSKQTSEIADQLKEAGHTQLIKDKTGLVIDSYFSATKVKDRAEIIATPAAKPSKPSIRFNVFVIPTTQNKVIGIDNHFK